MKDYTKRVPEEYYNDLSESLPMAAEEQASYGNN